MGGNGALHRLASLSIAVCLTVLAPMTAGAAASNSPSATGPVAGSAIPPVGQVQAQLLAPGPRTGSNAREVPPARTKDPAALRSAKQKAQAAPAGPAAAAPSTSAPSTSAPSAAGLYNGLNAAGFAASDEGYQPTPPDSTGAIGPTRYLELVNNLVGVYDRGNLARLSSTDLGTFSAAPSGTTTTDVQIQWDPQGNRWFVANISFNSNFTSNFILFGWSKTSNPDDLANGWCHYVIPTGSNIPDFPKLGHDANFVMISDNVFDGSKSGLPFVTADIWAIPKPPANQSTCSASVASTHFADATHPLKNADGTLAATAVPANTVDASTNGYIVSAHDPSTSPQTKVMVWQMTPGPTLVAKGEITVGTYSVPPSVPQPGTSFQIDSLDGRFTQAVSNFDPSAGAEAVWAQHTVAGGAGTVVRWYEFLPATLAIRQQGRLTSSTDYYWNAAISPSIAGNDAVIEYNRGSASVLSLIGAQSRTGSTPLGQMDPGEVMLAQSSASDQETLFQGNCSPNPCRWGDYSGATPDPLNPGVVWGTNQIDGAPFLGFAQWTTQNFAITTAGVPPTAPAAPTGLSATALDASRISLTWNPSSGATSYKIQRSPDGTTGWTQVGAGSSTSFTDSGLSPTTTYFYRVIASNSVGDSGPSTVASARTATSIPYSQSPQGSWLASYGAGGYALLGWGNSDLVSLPQSTLVIDQGAHFEWNGGTTAVQALQSPDGTTRHAAADYFDGGPVRLHLTFSSAYSGTIHLYALDWDGRGRLETITVNDGSGPQTANIATDFSQGAWVNAPINVAAGGTVSVTVTLTGGLNAVLSGIFLGGATQAPSAPTGLSATALNSSQIKLGWTASTGAGTYKVQRSPDGSTAWGQVGTSSSTSFTDSNLVPSTAYFYRVLASSGPSDSAPSNVASATTAAGLAYSQSPQGSWVGTYGADGYALLGWGGSDLVSLPQSSLVIDQGAHYEWTGSTAAVQALQSPDATARHAACVYDGSQVRLHLTFASAYSGTLHLYLLDWDAKGRREIITVNDGSGPQTANVTTDFSQGAWINLPINVGAGGTLTITVTLTGGLNAVLSGIFLGAAPAPVPPTGLSASPVNSSQISLSWTASNGATSYKIQRSADGSTGWNQVGVTSTTVFTDSGLSPSTTYFYRVLATSGAIDSGPSNVASATTAAGLAYTQSPQGSWIGSYGGSGYALLGWGNGNLVSLPQSTLVIDQGGLFEWNSGTSAVQALQSPDASTRHAACVYDGSQVRLHLSFSSAYSGTVHIYALDWDSRGRLETITVDDGSGPQTATITTDISQGVWVNAPVNVAAGGTVSITATLTGGLNAVLSGIFLGGAPALTAPTGLTASGLDASRVSLSWTGSGGATSYKVQRSPDGTTGWAQVGTTASTTFADSGLNAATTYFYRVLASNGGGDSAPSNVASAKTATAVAYTQSPQGNWVGTYGAKGYALLGWTGSGDLVSLPQSTLALDQGARFEWNGGTTAVQALQSPDATTRHAACFYDGNQVRLHLTFSSAYSGTLHLYALDWDGSGRRETITISDGSSLQTANITTDFSQGAWINVPVSVAAGGTLTITVTQTAGPNAVLSGIFLG